MKTKKAKLFNPKLFPMDLGRIACSAMPLFMGIKKLYVSDKAKSHIRGGAIIAANHTGFFDPVLVGNSFWYRRMFFLAAKEVTEKKFFGPLMRLAGCIPIDRGICDVTAIKKSVSLLKEGHTLTIFPQGGIYRDEDISAIKGGIILMAMQAKVPVVPVYIKKKTAKGEKNTIVIGEAFYCFDPEKNAMPKISEINSAADKVLSKMIECQKFFEQHEGGLENEYS